MEIYDAPNNLPLPDYHRLDVGLNFHRRTRKGGQITWNLSIYNAYCRLNPIFGYVGEESMYNADTDSYEDTGRMVGYSIGIVPIIPTLGFTYKF